MEKMNYNELKEKVHSSAVNHGFWNERRSNEHCLMLVITEIAELVEADRKGDKAGHGAKLLVKQDLDKGESFEEVFVPNVKHTIGRITMALTLPPTLKRRCVITSCAQSCMAKSINQIQCNCITKEKQHETC